MKNKLADDLEDQFTEIAYEYCLRMELVEACDWDEEAALKLYEAAAQALQEVMEYAAYDKSVLTDNPTFNTTMKANLPPQTEPHQAEVVMKILYHELTAAAERFEKEQQGNAELN